MKGDWHEEGETVEGLVGEMSLVVVEGINGTCEQNLMNHRQLLKRIESW